MARKLKVGDTLNEVFGTYGAHAGVLLPVAFWLFLVVAVIDGLAGDDVGVLLLGLVVATIAGTLYQGVVVNLVRDVADGKRDHSISELLRMSTPFILPLLGAGILSGIGIVIGFALLIVPGLILLTIWSLIAPVIVIEKSGVIDAFGRSRELVKGNGWPVFGVIFSAFLIAAIGSVLFGSIAEAITDGPLLRIVASALAATITAPIGALAAAVLYYRLREIREAEPNLASSL